MGVSEWRLLFIMNKVVKFGGSSLASAEQFKKVESIIRADRERRFVEMCQTHEKSEGHLTASSNNGNSI